MKKGEHQESISKLAYEIGYTSDSTVNTNLNELIVGGYVTGGPPYKVTKKGENELRFTRFPEYFLAIILAIGGVDIIVSLEDFAGLGPINPISTMALGVGLLISGWLFLKVKRRVYRDFLGLKGSSNQRNLLSYSESPPLLNRGRTRRLQAQLRRW